MTLIAGAIHWNGICLAADTRQTIKITKNNKVTYDYVDNVLKITTLGNGLDITFSGDLDAGISFYKLLKEKFAEPLKITSSDNPIHLLILSVRECLSDLEHCEGVRGRSSGETEIKGLIAGVIPNIPKMLFPLECRNILRLLGVFRLPRYLPEYFNIEKIKQCALNKIDRVVFKAPHYFFLLAFENKFGTGTNPGTCDVYNVPFGDIKVFGSGVAQNHNIEKDNTLYYMLLNSPKFDLSDAAFHLTRTHGLSNISVPADKITGFKTFGGAIVAAVVFPDPKNLSMTTTQVMTGKIFSKLDNKMKSFVFTKDNKLWVKTEEGRIFKLRNIDEIESKAEGNVTLLS